MIAEEQQTNVQFNSQPPPQPPSKAPSQAWRGLLILAVLGLAVLGYFIVTGIHARAEAKSNLERDTLAISVPAVAVIHPKTIAGAEEVVLPGNMQAFTDTPIWARASGYLKAWHADIGTHVQKGQLLAEIEAPEVDQQLQAAREQLATDEANLKLAEITADRYVGLLKQDSIAKQDVDTAVQNSKARAATFNASQANVKRLEQMVAYEKVYAPFNGVITARNIDVGALINAGANAPGKELFHIASNAVLRVYVSVPETYSRAAKPGVGAYLTLNEFPGRQFHGIVVRNADAIDMSSRTLLVEVDVKNPTGELLPGSYTSVHLKLPSKIEAVTVPSNTLLFRAEGLQIALVRDGRTVLVPVIMGRDYGDTVEIVNGVKPGDSVIVNPSDSIVSGEKVQVTGS
jgi:RND family efflux transporter MFP subunit